MRRVIAYVTPLAALFVLALALAAAPAAPAAAPLGPLPAEHGSAHPLSDGVRYVLLNRAPGTIRVLDTRTGTGRDVTVRERCTARGATANWGLVGCDDDSNPWLMRLSTRRMAPLDLGSGNGTQWNAIGRHWLAGGYHGAVRPVVVYAPWRPQERGRGGGYSGDAFESPNFDLDDPKLRPVPEQHMIFDRDGRGGLLKDLRKARGSDTRLVLDRGSRRVVLSRCRRSCTLGTLSGGVATWYEHPGVVRAYVERSGRRHSWRVPGAAAPSSVVHTRTHVLVSVARGLGAPRVYWARLGS